DMSPLFPPKLHPLCPLSLGRPVTENSSTLYLGRKQYVTTSPPIRKPGGDRTCSPPSANKTSVDFERTREAYRSKASSELLRSLLVFKLCSYDFLVDNNMEIMDLGKKILGPKAFDQLMKITFYGQFVAGEDHVAIKPLIQKNQAFGVGSVLDYSVEEDISRNENQEINSCVSAAGKESTGEDYKQKNSGAHRQLGDSHGERNRACTYFYADEAKCDQHMETFIKCIEASGGMDGFSAIKMTALGRPQFLFQFSEVLVKWQRLFTFLASQQGKGGMEALEQRLELAQLQVVAGFCGLKDVEDRWFKHYDLSLCMQHTLGKLEPLLQKFTTEEEKQLERILLRLDTLVKVIANQIENLLQACTYHFYQVSFSVNLWKVFGLCAEEMALNKKANVMVASHNEDTVKHTLERQAAKMKGVIVVRPSPLIPGRAGFPVYKYVPYGPVSEVMPYLSRRAQENRGFMKGAQKERDLLWKELKRRLVSGELLYRPV
uniref:Proline dehydrogenase n=1 Tax=Nothobranchius furzeri TaxID=105023 RepID=A0A8C6PM47_NOTFU